MYVIYHIACQSSFFSRGEITQPSALSFCLVVHGDPEDIKTFTFLYFYWTSTEHVDVLRIS